MYWYFGESSLIANAPRYVPITVLHQDLNIKLIKEVIQETGLSLYKQIGGGFRIGYSEDKALWT